MSTTEPNIDRVIDAPSDNFVYRILPRWLWPHAQLARWDRPIGWQLLMWPCFWSSALAANALVRTYAAAVAGLLDGAGRQASEVRAIGAHGQTVRPIKAIYADSLEELEELVAFSNKVVVLRDRKKVAELQGDDINPQRIMQAIASN